MFDIKQIRMRYLKYRHMFKKLAILSLWFLITPILLAASIVFLIKKNGGDQLPNIPTSVATEVNSQNNLDGQVLAIEISDLRPLIVADFLQNTPLEPYSEQLVNTADKYGLDYRLIPAIAMKETEGGLKAPQDSFNAWGFENGRTNFNSWESAIEIVARTLKEKYINRGLATPEQIMTVYAPPQLFTGGKWARDINFFFSQMEAL